MRRLRDPQLNLTRRGASRPLRQRFRAVLLVLAIVSAGLLLLERLHNPLVRDLRWRVAELLTPVLSAAVEPLAPLRWVRTRFEATRMTADEIERLRADSRRLAAAQARASALERQLAELSALARVVPAHAIPYVSARVIATSSGVFVRTLTIDAGRDDGVRSGYPVVSADGLIGRIVDAGAASARVLLLTDLNSRVPVVVGRDAVRAILRGDNSGAPQLEFVAAEANLSDGDEVVTSGVGGVFPRGLRVGRVVRSGRTWRVAPHAALDAIAFASVLRHDTALGDLDNDSASAAAQGVDAAGRALAGAAARSEAERAP